MAENGHFGILVVNFKRRQNHTIWGLFESSQALETEKLIKDIFQQKMALARHVVKIRKIALERRKEGQ